MWSFGSLIGVLIAGVVLGFIGKAIAPGEQKIPVWLTIVAGIVGAFIGNLLASWLGVRHTSGIDWWRHIFQVIAAVLAVIAAASLYPKVRAGSKA
jgi:uncharacterized membrane protein YeaQ/YmgE (transglycosylase-associated protein family)